MEIIPITLEEFATLKNSLTHVHQQYVTSTLNAYSGTHSAIGEIIITSDPLQCLLLIPKAAQIGNEVVLSHAA